VIDSFRYKHHKVSNHNQQYVFHLLLLQKYYNVAIKLHKCLVLLRGNLWNQCKKCDNNSELASIKCFPLYCTTYNVLIRLFSYSTASNSTPISTLLTAPINLEAMMFIVPASSRAITGYIY